MGWNRWEHNRRAAEGLAHHSEMCTQCKVQNLPIQLFNFLKLHKFGPCLSYKHRHSHSLQSFYFVYSLLQHCKWLKLSSMWLPRDIFNKNKLSHSARDWSDCIIYSGGTSCNRCATQLSQISIGAHVMLCSLQRSQLQNRHFIWPFSIWFFITEVEFLLFSPSGG